MARSLLLATTPTAAVQRALAAARWPMHPVSEDDRGGLIVDFEVGYLVLPHSIAADFARATAQATRPGQGIEQRALADFIQRGYYTAHLRRMRARYPARQTALRAALKEAFGPSVELSGGEAGLHLVMWLPQGIRDTYVAARAEALGLGVRALGSYTRAPMICNGLVLGYGNLEEKIVSEGVRRLVLAIQPQNNNMRKG